MTATVLRIRRGDTEIEISGEPGFVKEHLPGLLAFVQETPSAAPKSNSRAHRDAPSSGDIPAEAPINPNEAPLAFSTADIIARMGQSTGTALVSAAAVQLTLAQGKAVFSREELLQEMRTATNYFTISHRKSLSRYIKVAMENSRLREPSSGKYSVAAGYLGEMRAMLANS